MPKKILENKKIEILDNYLENLLLLDLKVTDQEFCKKNNISRSLLNKWINEFGMPKTLTDYYQQIYIHRNFKYYLIKNVSLILFCIWFVTENMLVRFS